MPAEFRRKNIRLSRENYIGRRLYFLTLCFYKRQRLGSNSQIAAWLIKSLRRHAAARGFAIHAYCVMPDHMHLLALGERGDCDLLTFVRSFKQDSGFKFMARTGRRLWQARYYDHVVRAGDPADGIAAYIWTNPVRKKICVSPQEYSFSGSFSDFGRKMFRSTDAAHWVPPWKSDI